MDKEKFTSMTVYGGLFQDDRNLLQKCFDKETGECDHEKFSEYCLINLQKQTSSRIMGLNKVISEAIREFEFLGQWTTLSQIFRSLPESIKNASRYETMNLKMDEYADEMNTFIDMGSVGRKRALELYKRETNNEEGKGGI